MYHLINYVHKQWQPILEKALECMDQSYVMQLEKNLDCLPVLDKIFAAFHQSLDNTRYILLGESPYPRPESANGYAFWDASVADLWSEKGMSKQVNRATSLRNFLKMLLVARGDLKADRSQEAIARLDKTRYWQTGNQFFTNMTKSGFLLLNASLCYSHKGLPFHAKHWRPFISSLFKQLFLLKPSLQLLLFGRIAAQIPEAALFTCLIAEHPYNLSFIDNAKLIAYFNPLDLLSYHDK